MKKILIYLTSLFILLTLFACQKNKTDECTELDVAKAIADIKSDEEGNVIIELIDGRIFMIGNLKGEKGDQGEKGEQGEKGDPGIDGKNGLNGQDGKDSYGNINISITPDQIIDGTNEAIDNIRDIIDNN